MKNYNMYPFLVGIYGQHHFVKSIHVVLYNLFISVCIIFHWMNKPQFIYPFYCEWAFELFPV